MSSPRSRPPTSASLAIDDAGFDGLDLEREVFGVDPALREAAGDEPQAGLRRALEHIAQLLSFAEAPDRADAGGDLGSEELFDQVLLAFPARGEHHQIGIFQQRSQVVELRQVDLALGDKVGAADFEVVAAAGDKVHELPAGAVLAVAQPEPFPLEPLEEVLVQMLRVLRSEFVSLPRKF